MLLRGRITKPIKTEVNIVCNKPYDKRYIFYVTQTKNCVMKHDNNILWPKLNDVIITGCVKKLVYLQMCS